MLDKLLLQARKKWSIWIIMDIIITAAFHRKIQKKEACWTLT